MGRPQARIAAVQFGFAVGILAILAIVSGNFIVLPLSGVLVLLWAWRSHTPWREIGYVRPRSWLKTIIVGVIFGVATVTFVMVYLMPGEKPSSVRASVSRKLRLFAVCSSRTASGKSSTSGHEST